MNHRQYAEVLGNKLIRWLKRKSRKLSEELLQAALILIGLDLEPAQVILEPLYSKNPNMIQSLRSLRMNSSQKRINRVRTTVKRDLRTSSLNALSFLLHNRDCFQTPMRLLSLATVLLCQPALPPMESLHASVTKSDPGAMLSFRRRKW